MPETRSLTTGQAAKYCQVSQTTIINWIKRDGLKAYTTPGGHYRILLSDFLSFLEAYDMPVDSALRTLSRPQVLIVGDSELILEVKQRLHERSFDVAFAESDHEASAQVARLEPDAVVLDFSSQTLDCPALCKWLRASPEGTSIGVLGLGNRGDERAADDSGADAFLPIAKVAERIETELEILLAARWKEE